MKTIYFVRHAQCQANAERLIAGSRNDSPLTMLGKQQADETGESLTGLKVDLIVCSPLSRAKDTALRIAEKIGYKGEIRTEPLLIERDFGSVTGTPDTKGFAAIDAGEVEDVEKLEDFAARMHQALEMFEALPGKVILAVGHSGAERMMRTLYEGRPYQTFLETEVVHNGKLREYEVGA